MTPLAVTEFAEERFAVVAGDRLIGVEDGLLDEDDKQLALALSNDAPVFVTDVGGTTLFATAGLFGGALAIRRFDRSAGTGWRVSTAAPPITVGLGSSILPIDRDTVVVEGADAQAHPVFEILRMADGAWQHSATLPRFGAPIAARGADPVVAYLVTSHDGIKVQTVSSTGVTDIGQIGDHVGQSGCCSLVGAAPARGGVAWIAVIALAGLLRATRALRRQSHR
jgi:hypothetical protein